MKIVLKLSRLSYPDLFKPGTPPPGSASGPKFGGQFIIEPTGENATTVKNAILAVAKEKFGDNFATFLKALPKDKKCLRVGNENLDNNGNVRDGYKDMLYVVARNKARPVVVDQARRPLTEADGKPYGGCYVNVSLDIYALDKPGQGKSVNATLLGVQFAGEGESFGGATGSADDFDDESGGAGDGADPFGDSGASTPAAAEEIDPFA